MADCLITVTGTSGSVLLRYILAGEQNNITAELGDSFIIPDTASSITFTTLSGDAIGAGSPCTPTPISFNSYDLIIKGIANYKVTGFIYNDTYYTITATEIADFDNLKERISNAKPDITLNSLNIISAGVSSYISYNFSAFYPISLELKFISVGQPDGRIVIDSEITPP